MRGRHNKYFVIFPSKTGFYYKKQQRGELSHD
jgi:hypothetical protein